METSFELLLVGVTENFCNMHSAIVQAYKSGGNSLSAAGRACEHGWQLDGEEIKPFRAPAVQATNGCKVGLVGLPVVK